MTGPENPETTDADALPPKIAKAICEVMAEVPKISKDHKNEHGKFMFASIDDFLEAMGPLCAKAKLLVLQDEESMEMIRSTDAKGADTSWVKVTYTFTLSHESGETWGRRLRRTSFVRSAMGPQAMGAAQSYALKQFERSLFKIATGDADDIDLQHHGRLPSREPVHGAMNKTKLQTALRAFDRDLHRCTDESELDGVIESYREVLEQCERDLPGWWESRPGSDTVGLEDRIKNQRAKIQKETQGGPTAATEAATAPTKLQRTIEASLRACISVENLDAFWGGQKSQHDGVDQDAYLRPIYENLRAILVEKESKSGKPEESDAPLLMP